MGVLDKNQEILLLPQPFPLEAGFCAFIISLSYIMNYIKYIADSLASRRLPGHPNCITKLPSKIRGIKHYRPSSPFNFLRNANINRLRNPPHRRPHIRPIPQIPHDKYLITIPIRTRILSPLQILL
jgi:hypothetical protein